MSALFSSLLDLEKSLIFTLIFFTICFSFLTLISPQIRNQALWREDTDVDLLYWLILPLLYETIYQFVSNRVLLAIHHGDARAVADFLEHGRGGIALLPVWAQGLIVLGISDFIQYWLHRLFHKKPFWKFHAIHHSAEEIDWLTSARFHPVNYLISFTAVSILIGLIGFSGKTFFILGSVNAILSALVHANLNWTFGPFKYVLASPVFHRWHHSSSEAERNRNFASTFPVLDLLFGTFYMPKGEEPFVFGAPEDKVPPGFLAQLAFPFFRTRKLESPTEDS
ncbi:MAG: sterol desaturase family protein [Blastocatellia bacterium]|nr:sterol desaturase family protein [Blastocatellia bacterium]